MVQHRCLRLQTNAFVIPCYINAWNCGAKCAELSCLSLVYVARGERKQDGHERPLSRTGLPDFLEFLKLLASGDGTCFLNPQNERNWKEEREAREREREKKRERMPGSGIGPCVRPVSDLFQTPAKGSSHIRKILPAPVQQLSGLRALEVAMKHQLEHGATPMPAIADQCFRNSMLHKRPELRSEVR